jgi:hypothetical protein
MQLHTIGHTNHHLHWHTLNRHTLTCIALALSHVELTSSDPVWIETAGNRLREVGDLSAHVLKKLPVISQVLLALLRANEC